MTIKLSSKGGGGSFVASFVSPTVTVLTGATGTYITLTPPSGERVKLTALGASAKQTNLTTVTVGGVDRVIGVILEGYAAITDAVAVNEFKIGFGSPNQAPFTGEPDEVVEIKTNVATSSQTAYTYQFGK